MKLFSYNFSYNEAITIIKNGGVGIIPTETVYGLVCDVRIKKSVERIFNIKNRDFNKPLSVAIRDIRELKNWTSSISQIAKELIDVFWPGPLTFLFNAAKNVPEYIKGKSNIVGIRMPNHEVPISIMKSLNTSLVLTSANISGKKSPAKIEDIKLDNIDFIIDYGPTEIGIESTILDVSGKNVKLIREGAISKERLFEFTGQL